jgi:hypothetical protein
MEGGHARIFDQLYVIRRHDTAEIAREVRRSGCRTAVAKTDRRMPPVSGLTQDVYESINDWPRKSTEHFR